MIFRRFAPIGLLIAGIRPEFGLALVAAVSMYQFDPAIRAGKPTATLLTRKQSFTLSMPTPVSLVDDAATLQDDSDLANRVREHPEFLARAAALDHPLHPISARAAAFPATMRGKTTQGSAEVEVVIDGNGRARVPRIVSASDPAFGYAAVQAVACWIFTPPQVNGHRVFTNARVPFVFKST
jgi:TonB family protein